MFSPFFGNRSGTVALSIHHKFVHVTPAPAFARLDRLHDGMLASVKMFGGMFIFGGIAASHVAANEAHAQMDPRVSRLQTILATVCARLHFFDFFQVRTFRLRRHFIPPSNLISFYHTWGIIRTSWAE
jgi:hypothetical protein